MAVVPCVRMAASASRWPLWQRNFPIRPYMGADSFTGWGATDWQAAKGAVTSAVMTVRRATGVDMGMGNPPIGQWGRAAVKTACDSRQAQIYCINVQVSRFWACGDTPQRKPAGVGAIARTCAPVSLQRADRGQLPALGTRLPALATSPATVARPGLAAARAGHGEVNTFLATLAERPRLSPASRRQALQALLFLFRQVWGRDLLDAD